MAYGPRVLLGTVDRELPLSGRWWFVTLHLSKYRRLCNGGIRSLAAQLL